MDKVRAKKHLGQHFLKDENIAKNIADTLTLNGYKKVLEIGPGMGVLTKYILDKPVETFVIEIDTESVEYLNTHYTKLHGHIISKDFLKYFPFGSFIGTIFLVEILLSVSSLFEAFNPYNVSFLSNFYVD